MTEKRRIEKKAHPDLFEAVLRGDKKFDLRLADFECETYDILVLLEWDSENEKYTGRFIEKEITFILRTKDLEFWPKKEVEKHGFQIMSLK